ncbi:MAG TPA: hypothetical protein GX530_05485 [Corynebacteriales bacterium]|nr:hypothetical protein [Mycobacteriales bacterium]
MEIPPKVTAPVFAGEFEDGLPFVLGTTHYPIKQVNYLAIPIGKLEQYFANDPEILSFVRMLVIQAMRQNQSGMYRRWHSETLVREVMEKFAK